MKLLLRWAICALMPAHGGLPGAADTGVGPFVDQLWRETTCAVWGTLLAGALLVVFTPVFTVFVPLPSMLLPAALRDRHVERIVGTRFYLARQAVFLLKMYACMCWGQDPVVRRHFHLDPYPADPGTFRTG